MRNGPAAQRAIRSGVVVDHQQPASHPGHLDERGTAIRQGTSRAAPASRSPGRRCHRRRAGRSHRLPEVGPGAESGCRPGDHVGIQVHTGHLAPGGLVERQVGAGSAPDIEHPHAGLWVDQRATRPAGIHGPVVPGRCRRRGGTEPRTPLWSMTSSQARNLSRIACTVAMPRRVVSIPSRRSVVDSLWMVWTPLPSRRNRTSLPTTSSRSAVAQWPPGRGPPLRTGWPSRNDTSTRSVGIGPWHGREEDSISVGRSARRPGSRTRTPRRGTPPSRRDPGWCPRRRSRCRWRCGWPRPGSRCRRTRPAGRPS